MEIKLKHSYSSTYLNVVADNVNIEECISEVQYGLKTDGKKDYSKRIGEDITNEGISMLVGVLDDAVYYRQADYDFSDLIRNMVNKMPQEQLESLIKELYKDYVTEETI